MTTVVSLIIKPSRTSLVKYTSTVLTHESREMPLPIG